MNKERKMIKKSSRRGRGRRGGDGEDADELGQEKAKEEW